MSDPRNSENTAAPTTVDPSTEFQAEKAASARTAVQTRTGDRRWWLKLFIQPLLMLVAGAMLFAGLGLAQRLGWISSSGGSGGGHDHSHAANSGDSVQYICPMMCTPPQSEPGRCPVCAMELVPAASGSGVGGSTSIEIDPVARRVANIQTVAVQSLPMTRAIRAVGELSYDEGSLKTISAYVDGRLDRLYADYTGVVVNKDDHLALVYSPRLYSGQVELLLAKKAAQENRAISSSRFQLTDDSLYETARERLIELGMTAEQIERLEANGKANSRMHLCAPIGGTVIEKHAVEGQYVKEGQAIYQLADLSTVWLMLELFPEDAAAVRYGQQVEAVVQSLPNRKFNGRVAFVDPQVDPKTRTVGVRVVISNEGGLLRVGDFAKATINVPLGHSGSEPVPIYDPVLADKWISPRHPHVVASSAGDCPICGVDLVPASRFGFTDQPTAENQALVVPRSAVLMAGENSVVYVETEPGRFEIRRVVLGSQSENQVVILSGVEAGEQVAARGNFLIDSQMQLAGNPSLIDPTKASPKAKLDSTPSPEIIAALAKLPEDDRRWAEQQGICPVADMTLGSMGTPKKINVDGKPVFICCEGCRESLLAEPQKYLEKLEQRENSSDNNSPPMDLPPIGVPEMIESSSSLPPIEAIKPIVPETPKNRVAAGHEEVTQ